MQIKVGDGLTAVEQVDTGSLDFLVVDAGSSNASLAISCPPAAFLEPRFLGQAAAALKEHGVLVVNCVTRSEAAFAAAVKAIKVPLGTLSGSLDPCWRLSVSLFNCPSLYVDIKHRIILYQHADTTRCVHTEAGALLLGKALSAHIYPEYSPPPNPCTMGYVSWQTPETNLLRETAIKLRLLCRVHFLK